MAYVMVLYARLDKNDAAQFTIVKLGLGYLGRSPSTTLSGAYQALDAPQLCTHKVRKLEQYQHYRSVVRCARNIMRRYTPRIIN